MHETVSLSPAEKTLAHIEVLLEQIYDGIQALRDEESQAWFWTPKIQKEIRQAEAELKRGDYVDFKDSANLLSYLDSLTEGQNAEIKAA